MKTNGPDYLRKRMIAARESGRVSHYIGIRREWLRALCRCQITADERRAFANVERPNVSPALDR